MRPALLAPLVLAACASFPTLDARISAEDRAAPIPALVPLAPVLAAADAGGAAPPAYLSGRLAALAARADALRGPVIDAPTTLRIADTVR